jgi:hypothetical protein
MVTGMRAKRRKRFRAKHWKLGHVRQLGATKPWHAFDQKITSDCPKIELVVRHGSVIAEREAGAEAYLDRAHSATCTLLIRTIELVANLGLPFPVWSDIHSLPHARLAGHHDAAGADMDPKPRLDRPGGK